ncbi:uncharacterized protein LOC129750608 [Uranotaenia lowii]|uniref:uncharacterized protein LOC129750608 n=1 Tax=Uranotaenia lowii TaxID=190385 RepID=UPI00247A94D1|nr:uncharacterized protein LOC129750608 [Uranotaenia lowii]
MARLCTLVLVTFSIFLDCCSKKIELELQRVEQIGGEGFVTSNLRVRKFNRTTAVVSGTIQYHEDLDNSFTFEMQSAYSALGNNQFNEYPMNLKKQSFCDFLNTTYREYQHLWKDSSDWIQVGPEGLCPWPKGTYTFTDLWLTDTSDIPPVVPAGLWRIGVVYTGPKQQKAIIQFFSKVYYS